MLGLGEMTQQLNALVTLREDLGSVPSSHTEQHTLHVNPAPGNPTLSSGLIDYLHTSSIHIYTQVQICTHGIKKTIF